MTSPAPSPPAYAELQALSNFSFLEGGSHAEEIVAEAKALGLAAIAICDRNTLAGVVRAHVAAREVGLQLVIGARLDLEDAPGLICLPTDRAAYGRLARLLSLGKMRAGKGRCSLTLADVAAHGQGQVFIALPPDDWDWRETDDDQLASAGSADVIPFPAAKAARQSAGKASSARAGDAAFEARLRRVKAALAPAARVHLAASHRYRGDDRARICALARLAARCATPLVATNDVLYHAPHRRPLQDVLTCIRHGTTIEEAGYLLTANAERHLKSAAHMARLFKGFEDALERTLQIAQMCRFSLDELVYEYPDEPVPPGRSAQAHLEALTWDGARWRFPQGVPEKVEVTIVKELALIAALDYAPYFLTVHDIVSFARSRGILAQGRGSAANSVVCYCLGITSVNPTEVDLLFERFVSEARKEPPDIDVDFEHERREEVIQYIYARYGRDRAGLAATVICYRARLAVREVGKAMGLSEDTVAALAGMVWGTRTTPGKGGGVLPEKHVREAGLDPADPRLAVALSLAEELTGFPRHLSQHVGGFVLTRGPLVEVVPVGNAAMADRTFIEWDKDDIDALGLLKVDVLALGMLTCIHRAFDLVREHHGRHLTLGTVPRDDRPTYDMLCRADSIGVFQVESRAQMNMLPRLKPRCFYDLVIEVAIVRPGPIQGDMVHPYLRRRSGLEPEEYPSPAPEHGPPDELRQILGKTKGVPLFQEQAMRIAMVAARFSDQEVDELRKAMATFRRRGTIGLLEEKMIEAMVARGYGPEFAQRCFNQIKGFGEYGFPESHAASFAHLVYVSAWLKCHYPAAFAAALLNSQPMGFYAPAQIVRDAREHGVEVREADVNHSGWDCTLEPGVRDGWPALRLGLRQIDGLAKADAELIMQARLPPPALRLRHGESACERDEDRSMPPHEPPEDLSGTQRLCPSLTPALPHQKSMEKGPFTTPQDLQMRAGIPHATIERLAAADAFRSMRLDRRQALWKVTALARAGPLPLLAWGQVSETGQEPEVGLPAMPLSEHVVNDYQTLRLSLKAHPMSFLREKLESLHALPCSRLREMKDGAWIAVAGVVLVRQRPGSAKGVVFMTIEDEGGIANAVIWPKTLERFRKEIMMARLVLIRGRLQRHEDIIHVVAARIEDRSGWLMELSEGAHDMPVPIANADEVRRPEPGSARGSQAPPSHRHPRDARIIPRSRDFH